MYGHWFMQKLIFTWKIRTAKPEVFFFLTQIWLVFEKHCDRLKHFNYILNQSTYTVIPFEENLCKLNQKIFQFLFKMGDFALNAVGWLGLFETANVTGEIVLSSTSSSRMVFSAIEMIWISFKVEEKREVSMLGRKTATLFKSGSFQWNSMSSKRETWYPHFPMFCAPTFESISCRNSIVPCWFDVTETSTRWLFKSFVFQTATKSNLAEKFLGTLLTFFGEDLSQEELQNLEHKTETSGFLGLRLPISCRFTVVHWKFIKGDWTWILGEPYQVMGSWHDFSQNLKIFFAFLGTGLGVANCEWQILEKLRRFFLSVGMTHYFGKTLRAVTTKQRYCSFLILKVKIQNVAACFVLQIFVTFFTILFPCKDIDTLCLKQQLPGQYTSPKESRTYFCIRSKKDVAWLHMKKNEFVCSSRGTLRTWQIDAYWWNSESRLPKDWKSFAVHAKFPRT